MLNDRIRRNIWLALTVMSVAVIIDRLVRVIDGTIEWPGLLCALISLLQTQAEGAESLKSAAGHTAQHAAYGLPFREDGPRTQGTVADKNQHKRCEPEYQQPAIYLLH